MKKTKAANLVMYQGLTHDQQLLDEIAESLMKGHMFKEVKKFFFYFLGAAPLVFLFSLFPPSALSQK